MARSTIFRITGIVLGLASLLALSGLIYFGLITLSEPYRRSSTATVGEIVDPARSGTLQTGDILLAFNGQRVFRCLRLFGSPFYVPGPTRAVPVPVHYLRPSTGLEAETQIVLNPPSASEKFERAVLFVVPAIFVAAGTIILVGSAPGWSQLLIGLVWCALGLSLAGWMNIYQSPLAVFAWGGTPVTCILLIVAHAVWPVYQLDRPPARRLLAGMAVLSTAYLAMLLLENQFGCRPGPAHWIAGLAQHAVGALYLALGLAAPAYLFLVVSAYRATNNQFSRLQIKAIAWAIGLGLGPVTVLNFLPLPWTPLSDGVLLLTGLLPITYLFVFYQGDLLRVDRYLNRLVFAFLFGAFWLALTVILARGMEYLNIRNAFLVGIAAALPPLLFAAFARERLGMLVDLVLYGVYYDYETVVSRIGLVLASTLDEEKLAEVVTRQLPQALSIRDAVLWICIAPDRLRRAGPGPAPNRPLSDFPPGGPEVEVFHETFRVSGVEGDWQAVVRLFSGQQLVGLVLLGAKLRSAAYAECDVRTLHTLASWIATTVANVRHLTGQREAAERERRLMSALVDNEERVRTEVAGELHDRGIRALGVARLMVAQARSPEVVSAALERVIGDLRELTYSRLSPAGLEQGLLPALEEMVERQRAMGLPVSLEAAGFAPEPAAPVPVQRELFYIAHQAVAGAFASGRAGAVRVIVGLAQQDGCLKLTVADDGPGAESARAGPDRQGMRVIEARASRIGAVLEVTPGSRVSVIVDLKAAGAA